VVVGVGVGDPEEDGGAPEPRNGQCRPHRGLCYPVPKDVDLYLNLSPDKAETKGPEPPIPSSPHALTQPEGFGV